MAILKVAKLGHPILRREALSLAYEDILSEETQKLISDMLETMQEYDGLGLAAPQVHVSKQIVCIESRGSTRYKNVPELPRMILINPKIDFLTDQSIGFWEGCLSVPDLRGKVERSKKIRVSYFDQTGIKRSLEAEGFLSVIIQHEVDHLQGKVFLDRMKDFSKLSYLSEYERYFVSSRD